MENKINLPLEFRKDFLSADGLTAISGLGHIFNVGDVVTHINNNSDEKAIIQKFGKDLRFNEIYAVTDLGGAPTLSLKKVEFNPQNNFVKLLNFEQALVVDLLKDGFVAYHHSSGEEFYLPLMIFKKDKDEWFTTNCPRLYTEGELLLMLSSCFEHLKDNPSLDFETYRNVYLAHPSAPLDFYDLLQREKLI